MSRNIQHLGNIEHLVGKDVKEIARIPKVDEKTFCDSYFRTKTPVVFTEIVKEWPAMQKWSPEFLKALAPDKLLYVEEGNVFQETTRFRQIRLHEYIDTVFYGGGAPDGERPAYLADFDIFGLSESLLDDVDFSLMRAHTLHTRMNGWIGPSG